MKSIQPVDTYPFIPAQGQTDQALTVDDTSGGVRFTAYDPGKVTHVLLTAETADMRFTLDGSAPTTTNGHLLKDGDVCTWPVAFFNAAKFIRTGTTSGAIHASPLWAVGA